MKLNKQAIINRCNAANKALRESPQFIGGDGGRALSADFDNAVASLRQITDKEWEAAGLDPLCGVLADPVIHALYPDPPPMADAEQEARDSLSATTRRLADELLGETWAPIRKTQDQYGFPVYWEKAGPRYVR